MPIRKLPLLLVNQIAAGEVIERPASVVKELVENSLDAGAKRIEITVEDGGRQLIRISDDGSGIPADELHLAIAPHATSKIATADQLAAIATFGFRGEALASIASVSRLRITSRPTTDGNTAHEAAIIEASGDQASDVRPAGGAPGTVIEIRDLFFNTPARRKFMRTAPTEFGHINDTVTRVAMVHPNVGFKLTHNTRVAIDLPPDQDHAQRCIELLGKDLREGLLEFEHTDLPERGSYRVWGLAGLPTIARSSSKFQYLCVNSRPVRDRNLMHAVKEAYRGLIPPDRQPVAVVFLEMDPAAVDVNVHPAKAEVRFRNPSQIHGLVLSAVRQRLLGADLTPSAQFAPPPALRTGHFSDQSSAPPPQAQPVSSNDFVNYFRKMDPTQKGFVYQQVRQAIAEEAPETLAATESETPAPPPTNLTPASANLAAQRILQVHKSYVVTQDDDGLVIVDQHALHERVMFEQLRQRVLGEGKPLESQRLLMPAVVDAGPSRQALLDDMKPLLDRIGIEAEPIGPDAVGIQAFPSFLFNRKVEPVSFMAELLDKVEDGDLDITSATAEEAALHEVLDMMACKAAVKAGDQMTEAELADLLAKRAEIERSSNCPHGRPTTLRLTLRDLERQFGRS